MPVTVESVVLEKKIKCLEMRCGCSMLDKKNF